MEIHRNDLSDVLEGLPDFESFRADATSDLFIATLGFENRTHCIVDKLVETGTKLATQLLLIKYPTNEEDNNENLPCFIHASEKMGGLHEITYSRYSYSRDLVDKLRSLISRPGSKVVFDVSTCSSYVFYPTIKTLIEMEVDLTLVYSEAAMYYPTREEWEGVAKKAQAESEEALYVQSFENAGFQSLGVDDIYSSPLFAEMNPGNKATLLAAVPNFSSMRMNAIITRDRELNKTSHENIVWIIGTPPADENEWRIDAIKLTNKLEHVGASNLKAVSTLQYKEMLKVLEDLWLEQRYKYQMTIGPLGSKMQHLGIFFFLMLHPEVGLWLAEPSQFQAKRFSTGHGNTWQMRFGPTKSLNKLLAKYMAFKWKW